MRFKSLLAVIATLVAIGTASVGWAKAPSRDACNGHGLRAPLPTRMVVVAITAFYSATKKGGGQRRAAIDRDRETGATIESTLKILL